jgi:hypothetical protein
MAVAEADHVDGLVLERGHAAANRGAARAVAVHHPDPDAVHREDLPTSEAPDQRGRVVVARHRLEGRDLFQQTRHRRVGEVPEMQDQVDARPGQPALERGR